MLRIKLKNIISLLCKRFLSFNQYIRYDYAQKNIVILWNFFSKFFVMTIIYNKYTEMKM